MPSLRTRLRYQNIALEQAQAALEGAAETLQDLQDGELDVDAITVGGVRFVESGGDLVPEP